jgi:AcrR family transcriptional regulator
VTPENRPGGRIPGRRTRRQEWSSLTASEKRERLLVAAASVFSRQGLDTPMSDVAEAAGAGVASVYRLYPSKYELYAALVVRRMDQIVDATQERVLAAARAEGRLRADASSLDLRLLFAATRAAKRLEPEHWPRMLELMLDALDTQRDHRRTEETP